MSIISVLAGALCVAGFIPYIYSIFRKETKPAKASWIIWSILDITILLGMYYENAVNGYIAGCVIGATIIALLSLKYGSPGWAGMDKFCLIGAVIGIALWQTFNDPILGIITSCVIGFIGSMPTFKSAWEDPERENKFAWTVWWISCILGVIAIPKLSIVDALPPFTFLTVQTIIVFIIFVRPFLITRKREKRIWDYYW